SQNGEMITTAGVENSIQVWNVTTGKNVTSLGDHSSTSLLVCFSLSGSFMAAAFEGGTVTIWDPNVSQEHLKHESYHTEPIACLEFSKASTLLASGSCDHVIQVRSVETGQVLYHLARHEGPVTLLVFSSSSLWLVSESDSNLVIIWDMSTGKVVHGMMGHCKAVNCVVVSNDCGTIASGSEDKTIKIWDTSSG
ncbi:WD40 repeat-like protein, partial [Imleria badia]